VRSALNFQGRYVQLQIDLAGSTFREVRTLVEQQRGAYVHSEASVRELLAGQFGAGWSNLKRHARLLLVTADTLFTLMAPTESGAAAALVQAYTAALEAQIRPHYGLAPRDRVSLGFIASIPWLLNKPDTMQRMTVDQRKAWLSIRTISDSFWLQEFPRSPAEKAVLEIGRSRPRDG
jgi:hypothetical protein